MKREDNNVFLMHIFSQSGHLLPFLSRARSSRGEHRFEEAVSPWENWREEEDIRVGGRQQEQEGTHNLFLAISIETKNASPIWWALRCEDSKEITIKHAEKKYDFLNDFFFD